MLDFFLDCPVATAPHKDGLKADHFSHARQGGDLLQKTFFHCPEVSERGFAGSSLL
ncbi:MAG: hypothetical protein K0Q74_1540 [Gammaproteobacteria bacterium]|nr:hypothetical protein [Gammaproteobacteria bacterium]